MDLMAAGPSWAPSSPRAVGSAPAGVAPLAPSPASPAPLPVAAPVAAPWQLFGVGFLQVLELLASLSALEGVSESGVNHRAAPATARPSSSSSSSSLAASAAGRETTPAQCLQVGII